MTFGDRKAWFEGEPCEGAGCAHLLIKHRAEHHGHCLACWAGATEEQRFAAAFGEEPPAKMTDPFVLRPDERTALASLEAIWEARA